MALKKGENEPNVLLCGEITKPVQLILVIEGHVIYNVGKEDSPFALMSAYIVF